MKRFVCILVVFMTFSCGSKKKIVTKKSERNSEVEVVTKPKRTSDIPKKIESPEKRKAPSSTQAYIDRYKPIAISEMQRYGIPASITLAQGILESGSGKGRLAVEANNHFGIKCHGWQGAKIYHDDDRSQE